MKDLIVVYMDASLYLGRDSEIAGWDKKQNCVGLGIYLIDENYNDVKIGKGFKTSKINKADIAELANINLFAQFVENNINYQNKKFIIYADSESVVRFFDKNIPQIHHVSQKKRMKILENIDVVGAYWVKGHKKERGNNLADVLSYNSMLTCREKDVDFESIAKNTRIKDIFDVVKRDNHGYWSTVEPIVINEETYLRAFEEDKNFKTKAESDYYRDKLTVIDNGTHYTAEIKGSESDYTINDKNEEHASFSGVVKNLFVSLAILKERQEFNAQKKIIIKIEDPNLCEKVNVIYKEARELFLVMRDLGKYKEISKEKFIEMSGEVMSSVNEFISQSDIHKGLFKLAKNNAFQIESPELKSNISLRM
ncbi:hypothetical protein [Serratia sp. Se-RSBMAAmG]|uniref:hypothetical protein n=1 Tax=Serratia sp. Se-RSBMAAmG TaxID=3043305 RepID=UPI0024AEA9A9|nr:hypothetical protein [Serratia sp. Se-RSBMAAmG]MDI6976265.1 hypothetical protein [Serratia sp. Se-RSBMAAmG]